MNQEVSGKDKYSETKSLGDYGAISGQYINMSHYTSSMNNYIKKDKRRYM